VKKPDMTSGKENEEKTLKHLFEMIIRSIRRPRHANPEPPRGAHHIMRRIDLNWIGW